tara:strand:+ start:1152 stop:1556 length:405 start_codon:yes stop_codon:yes gene_type:complete
MAITTPQIYIYKEINVDKFGSTRHYELNSRENNFKQPSKLLNISENRKFAKADPVYWVKTHTGKKWNKKILTGLFPAAMKDTYYGDINKRQHLLIFHFLDEGDCLLVYYFKNYYTRNLTPILEILKNSYTVTIN